MNVLVSFFTSIFKLITDNQLLGLPIFVWLVIPAIIAVVLDFIRGRK